MMSRLHWQKVGPTKGHQKLTGIYHFRQANYLEWSNVRARTEDLNFGLDPSSPSQARRLQDGKQGTRSIVKKAWLADNDE